jgi:hypothetical protein
MVVDGVPPASHRENYLVRQELFFRTMPAMVLGLWGESPLLAGFAHLPGTFAVVSGLFRKERLWQDLLFCHPERSEGSQLLENAEFLAALRMTNQGDLGFCNSL